ncbi:MAG: sugar phosphate isomerase/epimerase [Phycisphaerae bacterium]|nr:sugar phosphate isomerase/epimerase [Phycisphaerae bacterium]
MKVGAATLAAAGLGLGSATGAQTRPSHVRARAIKKAAMIGMVGVGSTVLDKFKALKDAGFEGVEMDSPHDLNSADVLRASEETGIRVHGVVDSVHWNAPLSDPSAEVRAKGLAALETALQDCKRWGGVSVLLVPAVVNKRVSYAEAYERSQAEIRKALPLAEKLGITIAIENVWNGFLLSPLEAARYVDEFKSPWVAWHFDVGNVINFGWPEQWIRTLGKRIVKLHIKEYSRKKRDELGLWKGFDVELTEGDCDWPSVMKALDEVGYEGWATAEVGGGDLKRLTFVSERMDRIFAL